MVYRFAVEPEVDNLVRGPVVKKYLFSVTRKIGFKFLRGSAYKVSRNQVISRFRLEIIGSNFMQSNSHKLVQFPGRVSAKAFRYFFTKIYLSWGCKGYGITPVILLLPIISVIGELRRIDSDYKEYRT